MNRLDRITHSTEALEVEDEIKNEEVVDSITLRVLEHALRLKCKHCSMLFQKIASHHCDRCFKEVPLLNLNRRYGSDFQLCDFCMEHD